MPIHDWLKVRAGVFHDFHQAWTIEIYKALNRGPLPPGYFAMAEQVTSSPIPDVVCLEKWPVAQQGQAERGGIAIGEKPPAAHVERRTIVSQYAAKANRIAIRQPLREVVAVIEIVSPGNKSSRSALESFVDKAVELLNRGIHLLIVDLFPPGKHDPKGIHHEIWEELGDGPEDTPRDKPLTAVSYSVGDEITAYVNTMAIGDNLPPAPVFLKFDWYVPVPLEGTYQSTWVDLPIPVKQLFEAKPPTG